MDTSGSFFPGYLLFQCAAGGKSYDEDQGLYFTDISSQRFNIQAIYSLSMIRTPG